MTDERTERRALEEFVRGPDVWAKWDAARRLMAAKQMQSAATNEDFRNSFRDLGRTAISGRVLLHFALLAGRVGAFHSELEMQISDEHTRALLRRQLPSNIFVQFLAGPREARTGIMGFMLRLIAQISLVAGPLALLTYFQLQFLPYHDEQIVWWHRITVVTDLALLWLFWPSLARGEMSWISWRELRGAKEGSDGSSRKSRARLFCFRLRNFPRRYPESEPADRVGANFGR